MKTTEQPEDFYYLDQDDHGQWLIKDRNNSLFTAGLDKEKVVDLILRLNEAHRPNVVQGEPNEIFVCWNTHEKWDKCDFVREI